MHLVTDQRGIKPFLWIMHLKSMSWPVNSEDLNPSENLWQRFKKTFHETVPSTKKDLLTAI